MLLILGLGQNLDRRLSLPRNLDCAKANDEMRESESRSQLWLVFKKCAADGIPFGSDAKKAGEFFNKFWQVEIAVSDRTPP